MFTIMVSSVLFTAIAAKISRSFLSRSKVRAPNFVSFKGVPSSLLRFFRGYFHPMFINLRGYYYMFKGALLSQDLSVTKSYLSVVFGFLV